MFDVAYDPLTGLITCTVSGFLTLEDVRVHMHILRTAMDRARRARSHVRILVLAYDLPVQKSEVAEKGRWIRQQTLALKQGDRMAYVFSSSLTKMQATRTFDLDHTRAFLSEPEARGWLMADDA